MGCFCRFQLSRFDLGVSAGLDLRLAAELDLSAAVPLLAPVSAALSARWLAAAPFAPDPAWLRIQWPEVRIAPASLSVLASLALADTLCRDVLGIELGAAGAATALARVVATLNARMSALLALDADTRPWTSLLPVMAQVEVVEAAVKAGVFAGLAAGTPSVRLAARADLSPDLSMATWRPVLLKVAALAPLVALGQSLRLDWTDPAVTEQLAARIRLLARISLPALADAALVLRLVARLDAVARLKLALGADPRRHDFLRVRAAVLRRARLALALLPPFIRLEAGALLGMPALEPNPGLVLNAGTVGLARLITPAILARLQWKVPGFDGLALLTTGLPVLHLVRAMAELGVDPVLPAPCAEGCDAGQVMRALGATASAGSGTGGARAG